MGAQGGSSAVSLKLLADGFYSFIVFSRHFRPRTHVSDSAFVTRDHNFGAFENRRAVFHARTAYPAGSGLRVDQFSRATFADGHGEPSEYTDHFIVGGIKGFIRRAEHAAEKQINDGRAAGAAQ